MNAKILWEAVQPCMFPYSTVKFYRDAKEIKIIFDYFEENLDAVRNTGFIFKSPMVLENYSEYLIPELKNPLRKIVSVCGLTEVNDSEIIKNIKKLNLDFFNMFKPHHYIILFGEGYGWFEIIATDYNMLPIKDGKLD